MKEEQVQSSYFDTDQISLSLDDLPYATLWLVNLEGQD